MRYTAPHMRIVTSSQDLSQAAQRLSTSDFVAVDTEFLREQTFWPQLCLIQIASPEEAMIIDPLAPGLDLAPFWKLMGEERVTKVFHAARQDIEIVYARAGLVPRPVFDTQVAAMVCGFGESVSYVNLVKNVTGIDLDKSSRFTDWSRRPLSDKQLEYALGDVTHLRDVYLHLKADIDKAGRADWLNEEMGVLTDHKTYESNPTEAWQRLKLRVKNRKALAVLMELAAWRERLAQSQDVPRARILRDEALYDIANQAPTSAEQLSQLRTLSEGFSRSARARDIIEAVKAGLERDLKSVPAISRGAQLSAEVDRAARIASRAAQGVGGATSRGAEADRRLGGPGAHCRRGRAGYSRAQGLAAAAVRRGCAALETGRDRADAGGQRGRGHSDDEAQPRSRAVSHRPTAITVIRCRAGYLRPGS